MPLISLPAFAVMNSDRRPPASRCTRTSGWLTGGTAFFSKFVNGGRLGNTRRPCSYEWTMCSGSISAFICGDSASYAATMFENAVLPPSACGGITSMP